VVVVGFVALRLSLTAGRVELDQATMCPTNGPVAYTIVLIDGTDEFSPVQKADLRRYFNELKDSVPKHSQIAIYAPQEMTQERLLTPALKICNPGDAEGVSGLAQNPAQIQRRYNKDFSEKLDSVLSQSLSSQGANMSPVMEMIQAVAIDALPVHSSKPKRLIIVSDMLQNMEWYSHYRDSIDFDTVRRNPNFQHVYVDLTGVDVDVLYVGRQGYEHLQTNGHGLFWDQYFQHMKGVLQSILRIGG
jgi:hypothetical protein